MTTVDFIIELFCRVDDAMLDARKHSQANLYPSEVVTLALLFALKGVGSRAFYRWLSRDFRPLFPKLPERTRLFRLFNSHRKWTRRFMAAPSLIGLIDSYGIELIHPRRDGRSQRQIGKKGKSNSRWIVGGKLCVLVNHLGRVVNWACDTANVYDMIVETILSMVTTVCHFQKIAHRVWTYFESRLAYTMALFNILVQWCGLTPDEDGFVHLSIAKFSL